MAQAKTTQANTTPVTTTSMTTTSTASCDAQQSSANFSLMSKKKVGSSADVQSKRRRPGRINAPRTRNGQFQTTKERNSPSPLISQAEMSSNPNAMEANIFFPVTSDSTSPTFLCPPPPCITMQELISTIESAIAEHNSLSHSVIGEKVSRTVYNTYFHNFVESYFHSHLPADLSTSTYHEIDSVIRNCLSQLGY